MLNLYDYMVVGHPRWGRLDKAKAWDVCQAEGDAWLEQNSAMIAQELGVNFKVTRWAQWLTIPEVQKNLDLLWDRYHDSYSIRESIRIDIDAFLRRREANTNLSEADWEALASHELEELAVYMYQTEVSRSVNLYPGSDPVSLQPKSPIAGLLPDVLTARQFVLFDIRPAQQ